MLIEIAVVLPLVFGTLSAMIDLGLVIRRADLLLSASRHGARVAAAQSRAVHMGGSLAQACNDDSGTSPVLTAAVELSFAYLTAVGLDTGTCVPGGSPVRSCTGNSFIVSAQFGDACEGGFGQRIVQISVVAKSSEPSCVFCLMPLSINGALRSESVFAAEVDCATLEPIACT